MNREQDQGEFARFVRTETWGGIVLFTAALLAVVWANSPWLPAYEAMLNATFGPASLDLHLSLDIWVRDGVLAIFFFVIGLELKRELVIGELANARTALFPVLAALGGVIVPALLAFAIMHGAPYADRAWAIPTATDIAFALGVLALFGSALPAGARLLLLALAVVDDLVAIMLIAVLFTDNIDLVMLGSAAACCALWAYLQHQRISTPLIYVPLALTTWGLLHASGVHATIAGVVLGLLTRVRTDPGEREAPALHLEHLLQPWSAAIVVPLFALFAAGVPLNATAVRAAVHDPIAIGVFAGLVVGKWLGILGASFLAERLRIARRPPGVSWRMVNALAALGGVGFTVALLVAELALPEHEADTAKAAVLLGSAVAIALSTIMLRTTRPTPN